MSNNSMFKVELTDINEIVKCRDSLIKYLNNHVGAKFKHWNADIEVRFVEELYFIIKGVSNLRNWIEGRAQLYFKTQNIKHKLIRLPSTSNFADGGFIFTSGKLYGYTKEGGTSLLRTLDGLNAHMFLTDINAIGLFNLTITKIYLIGNSNSVSVLYSVLRYFLKKQGTKGFDKELWEYLNSYELKNRVTILGIANNTAIDLLNLRYVESESSATNKEMATANLLDERLLEQNLDEYCNLDDFSLKSIGLLKAL